MLRLALFGGLAGAAISMTTGWLITGYLCHRFQNCYRCVFRRK